MDSVTKISIANIILILFAIILKSIHDYINQRKTSTRMHDKLDQLSTVMLQVATNSQSQIKDVNSVAEKIVVDLVKVMQDEADIEENIIEKKTDIFMIKKNNIL